MWWKFITEMKFHFIKLTHWPIEFCFTKFFTLMKIHHCAKNSSQTCNENFITYDEDSQLWWRVCTVMKFHSYDENSSLRWKFLTQMKILYSDENLWLWWKSIVVIKFITMMRIGHCDEIHQVIKNSSFQYIIQYSEHISSSW